MKVIRIPASDRYRGMVTITTDDGRVFKISGNPTDSEARAAVARVMEVRDGMATN